VPSADPFSTAVRKREGGGRGAVDEEKDVYSIGRPPIAVKVASIACVKRSEFRCDDKRRKSSFI
jgi:hypothetical protein